MSSDTVVCRQFKDICTCAESGIRLSDVGVLSEYFVSILLRDIVTDNDESDIRFCALPLASEEVMDYSLRCDGVLYVDNSYDAHTPDYMHKRVRLVSAIVAAWNTVDGTSVYIGTVGDIVVRKLKEGMVRDTAILLDMCVNATK